MKLFTCLMEELVLELYRHWWRLPALVVFTGTGGVYRHWWRSV
jgi:hypothetical protein